MPTPATTAIKLTTVDDALDLYASTVVVLGEAHSERATIRAAEVRARSNLHRSLNDGSRNVTAIRQEIDASVADMAAQVIELDGDIAASEITLRYLDVLLHHLKRDV